MTAGSRSRVRLLLFVLLTLGGGMLVGLTNPPGAWYAGLAKPSFTPPDWLFPVAWTVIYLLVGIAGWRIFEDGPLPARVLWVAQMMLNFSWSPAFFGAHRIGGGLVVIATLLAAIIAFMAATWRNDRTAFACFAPYAIWVAYATALNLSIWRLN